MSTTPEVPLPRQPLFWGLLLLYALSHRGSTWLAGVHWGDWCLIWLPSGVGALLAIYYGGRGACIGAVSSLIMSWSLYWSQDSHSDWLRSLLVGVTVSGIDGIQYTVFALMLGPDKRFRLREAGALRQMFVTIGASLLCTVPLFVLLPKLILHIADSQYAPWPWTPHILSEAEGLLISNGLGMLLILPLALALLTPGMRQSLAKTETLLVASALPFVMTLPRLFILQEYLVLPLLAWMALKSKMAGVALGMTIVGITTAIMIHYGLNPLGMLQANLALTTLGAYILCVSIPMLVLGTALDQLDEQNAHLEQIVSARTTALVEANAELQALAHHDPLTGAANRRYFIEETEKNILRAQRYEEPLCICILDIDHFKAINDQYGHGMGDQVLKQLATLCQSLLRESDLFARWGGEEFVILLPGVDIHEALQVADKLRMAVASSPIRFGQLQIAVSFSAGVAQCRANEDLDSMLSRADQGLYRAKASGRNRVLHLAD